MKVERLFQVLVITGASSAAGLVGCSDDNNPAPYPGTGGSGPSGTGGSGVAGTGGSGVAGTGGSGVAGTGGSSASCNCMTDPNAIPPGSWTDCNGCCCWLPAGTTTHAGPIAICGEEPCCAGNGR